MKFVNLEVAELPRVREIPEFWRIRRQNSNALNIRGGRARHETIADAYLLIAAHVVVSLPSNSTANITGTSGGKAPSVVYAT